jgi:hypothetical protein
MFLTVFTASTNKKPERRGQINDIWQLYVEHFSQFRQEQLECPFLENPF